MTENGSRRDRVAGALLGVHAGDALGATVEFSSWASIRARYPDGVRDIVGGGPFDWPPGHATDDTDLTRAVLLAYLTPSDDVVRAAGSGAGRAGNGSLMRCIPTALAVADRERRIRDSIEISAITHDDERCTVSCAAYNEVAAALLHGTAPDEAVEIGVRAAEELGNRPVADAIRYGAESRPAILAATGETGLPDNGAGFVLDSLSLAVAAVLDPRPLPAVLVDVVRVGYDTDTNAAIAGGLLGARDGAGAIPVAWRAPLQFGDEFTAAAERLVLRGSSTLGA